MISGYLSRYGKFFELERFHYSLRFDYLIIVFIFLSSLYFHIVCWYHIRITTIKYISLNIYKKKAREKKKKAFFAVWHFVDRYTLEFNVITVQSKKEKKKKKGMMICCQFLIFLFYFLSLFNKTLCYHYERKWLNVCWLASSFVKDLKFKNP